MDEHGNNFIKHNYWEMDENQLHYDLKDDTDLVLTANSLGGANGATFASLTNGPPSLHGCTQIPEAAWSSLVATSQMKPESSFCARTSEGRYGKLVVSKISMCEKYLTSERERERFTGEICVLEVSFLIWE
ncbi:hypothetical protein [Micromonospora sp. NPDC048839]|uniref:hypothetical protein n=1 Tax=Micromonospora sp. NPDC048839 TaxID=3155641 RepID=UPI0033DDDE88